MRTPSKRKGAYTITQDLVKELFTYKDGKLYWKDHSGGRSKKGKEAGCVNGLGYRQIAVNKKTCLAHRLIWLYFNGKYPESIDHINQDREDNRIENLRDVSAATNNRNMRISSRNTSGYTGVTWVASRKNWQASTQYDGANIQIGRFKEKENAVMAIMSAREQLGFHENHGSSL